MIPKLNDLVIIEYKDLTQFENYDHTNIDSLYCKTLYQPGWIVKNNDGVITILTNYDFDEEESTFFLIPESCVIKIYKMKEK
jgi:hypothetical protein